jgi:hypothetical protein
MFRNRQNSILTNFDAVIIVLIIFLCLMFYTNYSGNVNETRRKPVETSTAFTECCALNAPIERLQVYQKTWISNKDNYSLLAFNRSPLSENKKTDMRVVQLQTIRQGLSPVPQFILRYHIFPREMDDPPLLS